MLDYLWGYNDLNERYINMFLITSFVSAVKRIAFSVRSFFKYIWLRFRVGKELADVVTNISPGATTLDLSDRQLYKKSGSQLASVIKLTPPTVKTLKLCHNGFEQLNESAPMETPGERLARAFLGILPSVITLSLKGNHLGKIKNLNGLSLAKETAGKDLAHAFANIPWTVKELDLSENDLIVMPIECLKEAFSALKDKISILRLASNNLGGVGTSTVNQFKQLLGLIPDTVITLDLRNNKFGDNMSIEDFSECIKILGPNVKTLDLSDNFESKTYDELIQIFNALPRTVTNCILGEKANKTLLEKLFNEIHGEISINTVPNIGVEDFKKYHGIMGSIVKKLGLPDNFESKEYKDLIQKFETIIGNTIPITFSYGKNPQGLTSAENNATTRLLSLQNKQTFVT